MTRGPGGRPRVGPRIGPRARTAIGVLLPLAIVVPLAVLWWGSRAPASYSAMSMGEPDYGGGPRPAGHHGMAGTTSVADLDTPQNRKADVRVDLVARQGRVELADGRTIDGFSLNGTTPGPLIEATVGQLVEVHLHNADVRDGVALHWHGVDVPNAEDGVAGITQDAVMPGEDHTYRWIAPHAGTFWYHSHQVSHEQVRGGMLGPLLIRPAAPTPGVRDVLALSHVYGGRLSINGRRGFTPVEAEPGERLRVRLVNTDNGPQAAWLSAPYELLASDGYDVEDPTEVTGRRLVLPAGGRMDVGITVPASGAVRLSLGDTGLVLGPRGSEAPEVVEPKERLDLLDYGTPVSVPLASAKPDRRFTYSIGKRPGFLDGKPGLWWSVNGKIGRDMPMFVVREGDVVHVHISNHSGEVHPMHLHGHHAIVLARDGKPVTGSPWWFDSLDVQNGQSFDIAFLADNPGIWMDHCHNLQHAAEGLVTHLMYEGVSTPFRLGKDSGNEPE